jgi:hypothetical protein
MKYPMKFLTKFFGAVAVAGLIASGGAAFTAAGLTLSAGQEAKFVGGTVSVGVSGANIATIAYTSDASTTGIIKITLTFTSPQTLLEGKTPTVAVSGGGFFLISTGAAGTAGNSFACDALAAADYVSECAPVTAADTYKGMTGLTITVV